MTAQTKIKVRNPNHIIQSCILKEPRLDLSQMHCFWCLKDRIGRVKRHQDVAILSSDEEARRHEGAIFGSMPTGSLPAENSSMFENPHARACL